MNIKRKNLALIGYPGDYFKPFAEVLEKNGFTMFWVCSTHSDAVVLTKKLAIPSARVLDVAHSFDKHSGDVDQCRANLSQLESGSRPRVYDVILMDRILRTQPPLFALRYVEHLRRELVRFFIENQISLVSSGRDSALQLISMLVCRKLQIPWVVPTRLRIPLDTYGFCVGHETDTFLRFRASQAADRRWAEDVLEKFHGAYHRPALKIAARNLKDTIRLLKPHASQFVELLRRSYLDRGNVFSRYTIPRVIAKYLRRRINMITLNWTRPWSPPGNSPFCIYALHTQPESSIDVAGSFFSDQIALITFIARSLPVSHELYVKIHPTDVDGKSLAFYKQIKKVPAVRLIHDDVDSRTLIAKADIIFTLTGTMGHEGGLMGKPVITFARNYYNDLPTVYYCDNPPELPALVQKVLKMKPPEDLPERIVSFLLDYRTRVFDGEVNRMFGENPRALSTTDLEVLQDAYETLYQKLVVTDDSKTTSGQSPGAAALYN